MKPAPPVTSTWVTAPTLGPGRGAAICPSSIRKNWSFLRKPWSRSSWLASPLMTDVVLPCRNEAPALPALLSRMPSGYRPIVVDNGSSDGTAEVARAFGAEVVAVAEPGYGAAVHAGVLASDPDDG